MSDLIDLELARMKKETSPFLTIIDEDGIHWFKYGAEYIDAENKHFGFYFWAKNDNDAESRLTRIQSTAYLVGRLCEEIPA